MKQITQQLWSSTSINDISALLKNPPQWVAPLWWASALEIAELLKKSEQSWVTSEQISAQIATLLKAGNTNTTTPNTLQITPPDPSTLASNNPIAKKLQERAKSKSLAVAVVADKQELDDKICNVVFDQIKTRSSMPWFTLSILVSLIFFFYPLIRLFAYFYAGFLSVIYMLLRQMWFISVVPEEKIVDTWVVWDWYQWSTILSTLAFESKVALQAKKQSSAQIAAQHATPPTPSRSQKSSSNINDVLGWLWGWDWWNDNHIVTANSPQDTNTWDIPPPPKKNDAPHIEFWDFGWNFDKKRERNPLD